jgi:sec-independent protein translocase protein TatA
MVLGIFNIGNGEMLIILVIALVLFGSRLPDVARSLGKSVNSFKRGLKDVEDELQESMRDPPPSPPKSLPQQPPPSATTPTNAPSETHRTPQG